ncbi:hypothetical protein MTBBW1_1330006 [Desulfamplus magnetovallimortis]|uniref:Uncharacterized protein n=1 Tax=Desulfamplus magnetovallimortis TaxID=1246637 RepID=A0A1W1H7F8_9BACT|nr:hypothetical protein MTBBW1_1330006 [Desulfamplus magnetovallimortis]
MKKIIQTGDPRTVSRRLDALEKRTLFHGLPFLQRSMLQKINLNRLLLKNNFNKSIKLLSKTNNTMIFLIV